MWKWGCYWYRTEEKAEKLNKWCKLKEMKYGRKEEKEKKTLKRQVAIQFKEQTYKRI